jgi:DME family drug/metabolite transporter
VTLAGVAIISLSGGGRIQATPVAILWGLLAGFSYSLYYIFGKYFQNRYTAANLFLYLMPIGALGLWPFVDFYPKNGAAWLSLASLAFFSTYGAYYCYYTGLKHLEPTRAAITATLEPVITAVTAFIWWGELFTWQGYAGSALILIGVLFIATEGKRRKNL